jgi:hypothetical protein
MGNPDPTENTKLCVQLKVGWISGFVGGGKHVFQTLYLQDGDRKAIKGL